MTIKTVDGSTKPKKGEMIRMTVTFHSGSRYTYYGVSKRECESQFKDRWKNYTGFVKREFETVMEDDAN